MSLRTRLCTLTLAVTISQAMGCARPSQQPSPSGPQAASGQSVSSVPAPSAPQNGRTSNPTGTLPIATPVQGPATALPPPAQPNTSANSASPSASAVPVTIPVSHTALPPLRIDAGKIVPVIAPSDIDLSTLHRGSHFTLVVDDDNIPFRSGADESLEPGTKIVATVERVENGHVQFLFTKVVDGAGKSYEMIGL